MFYLLLIFYGMNCVCVSLQIHNSYKAATNAGILYKGTLKFNIKSKGVLSYVVADICMVENLEFSLCIYLRDFARELFSQRHIRIK